MSIKSRILGYITGSFFADLCLIGLLALIGHTAIGVVQTHSHDPGPIAEARMRERHCTEVGPCALQGVYKLAPTDYQEGIRVRVFVVAKPGWKDSMWGPIKKDLATTLGPNYAVELVVRKPATDQNSTGQRASKGGKA